MAAHWWAIADTSPDDSLTADVTPGSSFEGTEAVLIGARRHCVSEPLNDLGIPIPGCRSASTADEDGTCQGNKWLCLRLYPPEKAGTNLMPPPVRLVSHIGKFIEASFRSVHEFCTQNLPRRTLAKENALPVRVEDVFRGYCVPSRLQSSDAPPPVQCFHPAALTLCRG